MGLFSKLLITAGIAIANKVIDNKNSMIQEEIELRKQEVIQKSKCEQLRIKEQARLEELKQDYDMEKIETSSFNNNYINRNIFCFVCKKGIEANSKFCGFCGSKVERYFCAKCGNKFIDDAKFCGYCGASREE
ncbi:MAG: zinc ribbon domain-containing protein [Clostridia bacterium]|nr:zinc ribbon domain-containing protein [Clostridia bacterium]